MPVLNNLDIFWKQANVSQIWPVQVFNAVCISKLSYSLEALQPSETTASKLNSFQLKIDTMNINRANTNEEVYRMATLNFGTKRGCDP